MGEGSVYQGDVQFHGVLHINGDYIGRIEGTGDLAVGLTGRVKSVIQAKNVFVSGLVWGNIIANGNVSLSSTAIVFGDIEAASLKVEKGTIIHGKLRISRGREDQYLIVNKGASRYKRETSEEKKAPLLGESKEDQQKTLPDAPEGETGEEKKSDYSIW